MEWISVLDELPDDEQEYYVRVHDVRAPNAEWAYMTSAIYLVDKGYWVQACNNTPIEEKGYTGEANNRVVAWTRYMPK